MNESNPRNLKEQVEVIVLACNIEHLAFISNELLIASVINPNIFPMLHYPSYNCCRF